MSIRVLICVFALLGMTQRVIAADMFSGDNQCRDLQSSALLDLEKDRIWTEVYARYDESVDVAASKPWIYNRGPTFTWASETKVACGKAIGYLKGGTIDEEYVSKCDCFHKRMKTFMGYR